MIVVVCFMMIAVMASFALWSMTMTFSRQTKKTRDKEQAGILAHSVATLVEKELRQGRIVPNANEKTVLYEVDFSEKLDAEMLVMIVWKAEGACATKSNADVRKARTIQTERPGRLEADAVMVQTVATASDSSEEDAEHRTASLSEWELRVSCTIRNATTTVVRTSDLVMGEENAGSADASEFASEFASDGLDEGQGEDEIVLEDDIHAMQEN